MRATFQPAGRTIPQRSRTFTTELGASENGNEIGVESNNSVVPWNRLVEE